MNKNKKRRESENITHTKIVASNWRSIFLFSVFFLITALYSGRLYYLQIVKGDEYAAFAQGIRFTDNQTKPLRGNIYFQDKAGTTNFLAATNVEMPLVYAEPREIEDEEAILNTLDEIFNFTQKERETILQRLQNKRSSYALIARQITEEQELAIRAWGPKGIYIRNELVRLYPADRTGAHVLGFLGFQGDERVGQYGVEEFYDDYLSGEFKHNFSFKSLLGSDSNESASVELTIDYSIQFMLEKKLEELHKNLDAASASAVFMNPKTGEIIAMAQVPGFDPNNYAQETNVGVFKNISTQSVFELGSVFKPITIAAAIDAGVIMPETTYTDTGSIAIGGRTVKNFDGGARGLQTMTEVLEKSLNTGAVYVQQLLGKKRFKDYMEAFQLDKTTGIDMPGEVAGNIRNITNTNIDINFATASFGQGISFSPVRFLTSMSAIANKGVMMQPYIVKKITAPGQEIETQPKELGQPISPLTASRVTSMMVSVVDNGFDRKAVVPGYTVAGKTGTAQIPNKFGPGYSSETLHAFVGFAPAHNPVFIGMITVEKPKGIRFASDSIAPTFQEITSFILQYYKVPPQ